MGQNTKALLQLLLIVAVLTTLGTWIVPSKPLLAFWAVRIIAPAVATACAVILWRVAKRKERLPDLLGQMFGGNYFGADGVCFTAAVARDANGITWINVYAQNRYAGTAQLRIVLRPPNRSFSWGRVRGLPSVDETIPVEPGAFAVRSIPVPVVAKYHGRGVRYEVYASAKYPRGRAALLRYKEGLHVGRLPGAGDALLTLLGLLGGVVFIRRAATVTLQFPQGIVERLPEGLQPQDEVLWRYEGPVPQGFPVITRAA